MNPGKISESVLKRSVLRNIKQKNQAVVQGAGIGLDCALFDAERLAVSTDSYVLEDGRSVRDAVILTVNDIAAGGARPVAVTDSLFLPTEMEEIKLQHIIKEMDQACKELQIQIAGGHTEITDAVRSPILTITAFGDRQHGKVEEKAAAEDAANTYVVEKADAHAAAGMDVVLTKQIGLEGTSRIARLKDKELAVRYPVTLIEEAKGFDQYLSIVPEAATAVKSSVCLMHDVHRGGIFGALWELAARAGVGLIIELKQIPIRQETVEICEFYDLNPYELTSGGALLMITPDGNRLVEELEQQEIFASVIGKTTDNHDKLIINEEETRYLEPPRADEMDRFLQMYVEKGEKGKDIK